MERESHYAAVGAFIVLVLAMGVTFVYWLADNADKHSYQRYRIYFDGAVNGLTEGSAVRYLGVDVGRVKAILLDPDVPHRVEVLVNILTEAPLRTNTEASLQLQGVTGLAYIELRQGEGVGSTIDISTNEIPEIKASQSQLDKLFSSFPGLVDEVTRLTLNINRVLSDENIAHFSSALANLDSASKELPDAVKEFQQLMDDSSAAVIEIANAAQGFSDLSSDVKPRTVEIIQQLRNSANNMNEVSARVDELVNENRKGINQFVNVGLSELTQLIIESRSAASEIQELAESLKRNPSQILVQPTNVELEVPRK